MGFLDTVDDIDVPVTESVSLPKIQWYNARDGRPPMFFVNEDYLGESPTAPWQPSEFFDDNKLCSFIDMSTTPVNITVIGVRRSPFRRITQADGTIRRQFAKEWQQGMQLLTEALCFIDGIDEPVIWSSKGMTGVAFTDITKKARATIHKAAQQIKKKQWPLFAFALPVRVQHTAKGKVDFVKTSEGGTYTPPVLVVPEKITPQWLEGQFIGREQYQRCADILREHQESGWFNGIQPRQQAPVTRDDEGHGEDYIKDTNYSQDIEDDDIPF